MNPRKRRTIARAIMAGISPSELSSTTIKAFLEAERNNLDICTSDIDSILEEDNPVEAAAEVVNAAITTNEDSTVIIEDNVTSEANNINDSEANDSSNSLPMGLQIKLSMKNTKTQLLKTAKDLGLEVKPNMAKAKIFSLIESV
jgi:hypothetical protein